MKIKEWTIPCALLVVLASCATQRLPTLNDLEGREADFNFCLKQGILFLNMGDFPKALEQFNRATTLNPRSAKAFNLSGIAAFQSKNYRLANERFRRAVALDSAYAEAWNNMGSVAFVQRNFALAEELFKKTLALSPQSVSANYSLGTLLLSLGRTEEGMTYLAKGITLDPNYLERHKSFITPLSSPVFGAAELYFAYAKVFASQGNVERVVEYLAKAKKAGFRDWKRLLEDKDFSAVREDERVKEFLRPPAAEQ